MTTVSIARQGHKVIIHAMSVVYTDASDSDD